MAVNKTTMVLTFKHPRVSRVTQEMEGRRYFAGIDPHIINVGDVPKLPIEVANSVERGDQVWLWSLPIIVVRKQKSGVGHAAQITLFVRTLASHGAVLIEGSTGRKTSSKAQLAAMVDEAHRIIVKGSKRLSNTGGKPGRKTKVWPSMEIEKAAGRLWKSKSFPSDNAAKRAIMDQWSELVDEKGKPLVTERLIRSIGPSGRN